MQKVAAKSIGSGLGATLILLAVYFLTLTLVSGWSFAQSQFAAYWYFIISLAIGFGIQIGLYFYLKQLVKNSRLIVENGTVAVTGATSTLTMISCCAHYLANIAPILGIAGAFTVIAQYQVEVFWAGLVFNLFGIAFISNKVIKFKKHHE